MNKILLGASLSLFCAGGCGAAEVDSRGISLEQVSTLLVSMSKFVDEAKEKGVNFNDSGLSTKYLNFLTCVIKDASFAFSNEMVAQSFLCFSYALQDLSMTDIGIDGILLLGVRYPRYTKHCHRFIEAYIGILIRERAGRDNASILEALALCVKARDKLKRISETRTALMERVSWRAK